MLGVYLDCERQVTRALYYRYRGSRGRRVNGLQRVESLPSGAASTVCRPHAQQSFSSIPQNATLTPRMATAARLGLWPRQGPSVRVCGDVAAGFARCQAWLRTDIEGPITPDTPAGYAPSDLQTAYGLTSDSQNNGGGQTVAVVDAYDDPNVESDLNVYRAKFGLPACTISNGCFTKQKYTSQTNPSWAAEESVDVEMVSAICPNCKISPSRIGVDEHRRSQQRRAVRNQQGRLR